MKCNVKPFMGSEPKIVEIHARDDDGVVFPLVERLCKMGLRIWHDEEIRQVMIDYSLNWKSQHSKCNCFLVFLSKNAINSHVFRERFTNAVESLKPFVVISTIGNEDLSPGMMLQVKKAKGIIQSSYIPEEKLAEDLAGLATFQSCKGAPNTGVIISSFPTEETSNEPSSPSIKRNIAPSDRTILELQGKERADTPENKTMPKESQGSKTKPSEKPGTNEPDSCLEETLRITHNPATSEELEATLVPKRITLPVLVSLTSKEKMRGILGESMIGRAKKIQGSIADITFAEQCKLFSGKHFQLIYIDEVCMLVCKHPNGMNVNGTDLSDGEKYTVDSEAVIQIPSNNTLTQVADNSIVPAIIVIGTGAKAQELWGADSLACLHSKKTGETRCFTSRFKFGRENAWKTAVMVSRNISRNHADITFERDHYSFEDHSTNGTSINGKKINNKKVDLGDGDVISVQGNDQNEEEFIFRCAISLKGAK